jgi:hydroxymethylglutaryl-CoA lyase
MYFSGMENRNDLGGNHPIHLVECPRDAMQGWKDFIPTTSKIQYLNALLQVGFRTLDCGSFVSPAAIPQMADTGQVLRHLDCNGSLTRLLVIVANTRGAKEAASFPQVTYLGFPFSVSETFQQRNTNSSIAQSFERVKEIQDISIRNNKQLVVYMSMGFGNPYGDPYSEEIVGAWVEKLVGLGIRNISLADTVGLASSNQVFSLTQRMIRAFPDQEIGVHLHSRPEGWKEKVDAALRAGCNRFDGALKGIGGCPMANDELVGNLNTNLLIPYFESMHRLPVMNGKALAVCNQLADELFL